MLFLTFSVPARLGIVKSLMTSRNERRNSVLMTYHCSDLGSASDWLKQISRSFLIRHFAGKPVVGVAKCRPFLLDFLTIRLLVSICASRI